MDKEFPLNDNSEKNYLKSQKIKKKGQNQNMIVLLVLAEVMIVLFYYII